MPTATPLPTTPVERLSDNERYILRSITNFIKTHKALILRVLGDEVEPTLLSVETLETLLNNHEQRVLEKRAESLVRFAALPEGALFTDSEPQASDHTIDVYMKLLHDDGNAYNLGCFDPVNPNSTDEGLLDASYDYNNSDTRPVYPLQFDEVRAWATLVVRSLLEEHAADMNHITRVLRALGG